MSRSPLVLVPDPGIESDVPNIVSGLGPGPCVFTLGYDYRPHNEMQGDLTTRTIWEAFREINAVTCWKAIVAVRASKRQRGRRATVLVVGADLTLNLLVRGKHHTWWKKDSEEATLLRELRDYK